MRSKGESKKGPIMSLRERWFWYMLPFIWFVSQTLLSPGPHRVYWSFYSTCASLFWIFLFRYMMRSYAMPKGMGFYLVAMGSVATILYVIGDVEGFIRFEEVWDSAGDERTITMYNSNAHKYPPAVTLLEGMRWGTGFFIKVIFNGLASYLISLILVRRGLVAEEDRDARVDSNIVSVD